MREKERKETPKGVYTCRYCGKDLISFNCDCENSKKNSYLWKAKRMYNKKNEK